MTEIIWESLWAGRFAEQGTHFTVDIDAVQHSVKKIEFAGAVNPAHEKIVWLELARFKNFEARIEALQTKFDEVKKILTFHTSEELITNAVCLSSTLQILKAEQRYWEATETYENPLYVVYPEYF